MILLSLPIAYMILIFFCTVWGAVIGDRMEQGLGVGMVGTHAIRKRVAELVNPAIPALVCLSACMSSLIIAPFDDFIYVFPGTLLGMFVLRLSIVHLKK